jgi:hypothetical protein
MDDTDDLWVCTDCYIAHHYGYSTVERAATDDEVNAWLNGHRLDVAGEFDETPEGLIVRQWYAGEDPVLPCDRKPLALVDPDRLLDNTNSETGDGIDTFSWDSCEGCGSDLGGYRYRLSLKPTTKAG